MREKSLKWMFGTLIVIACLAAGVWLIARGSRKAVSAESATATPDGVSVTETPDTVLPAEGTVPTPTPVSTQEETPPPEIPEENPADEEILREYVRGMSIQDKIGQLVMFGFSGTSAVSSDFKEILNKYHVGNVVLYGSNIHRGDESGGFDTARKLTRRLQQANQTGIPLLISIDIEGGVVQRFSWTSPPNSARTLGKKNDRDRAYNQFLNVGKKLKDVGINMNLAPVMDISEDAMKTVLRTRIISGDPAVASNIGSAIIEGLKDASCLSTAKHFPGHGGTTVDSHATTPVIKSTLDDMRGYDLIPFQAAVDAGVDTVLVAHILYPNIDSEDIASMSRFFITDLLRGEMGHQGLVMSDDFRMAGVTSRYDVGEAAVKFILAGGDIILCGPRHDLQKKIMEGLTNAAESGALTEVRLDESVMRILTKKIAVINWTPVREEMDSSVG